MADSFDGALLNAYLGAEYMDTVSSCKLLVGNKHPSFERNLDINGGSTYAWITAWNPQSRVLQQSENKERNAALRAILKGYIISNGYSQSKSGEWHEEGFWVYDIDPVKLRYVCKEFHQNGFVFARRGQVLQLILI